MVYRRKMSEHSSKVRYIVCVVILCWLAATAIQSQLNTVAAEEEQARVPDRTEEKRPPCTMLAGDYVQGSWKETPPSLWKHKVQRAEETRRVQAAAGQTPSSLTEILSGYKCPANTIASAYSESWMCSRKQYGIGPMSTHVFPARNDTRYRLDSHFSPQARHCHLDSGYDFYLPVEQMPWWVYRKKRPAPWTLGSYG